MSSIRQVLSTGLAMVAGLIAAPQSMAPVQHLTEAVTYHEDERVQRLREFFGERDCPAEDLARDFVAAADLHGLDWRLLPGISFIESSGGKHYINNNIFGWDSGRTGFATVRDGVYHVASRLANSNLYKSKTVPQILRTYNSLPGYAPKVRQVMDALGPADLESPNELRRSSAF